MTKAEVLDWLTTIPDDNRIAVDDSAPILIAIPPQPPEEKPYEYLEIGGMTVYECVTCDWTSFHDPDGESCPKCKEGTILEGGVSI